MEAYPKQTTRLFKFLIILLLLVVLIESEGQLASVVMNIEHGTWHILLKMVLVLSACSLVYILFRKFKQLETAEREIRQIAYYDLLTGLPNRRYFMDSFTMKLNNLQQTNGSLMAVMFIDLDQFKWVNDSMGHEAGDLLLVEVVNRMKRCVRHKDFLARLGGDEFVLWLPDLEIAEDAQYVAKMIVETLNMPVYLQDREVRITPSIGICMYPEHGSDINVLMKNADMAMYHAKVNGGNSYQIYRPAMEKRVNNYFQIVSEFHKSLFRKEFELYYQPRIDFKTGRLESVEALIRWNHPERGLIMPMEFISIAEESNFILPLGEWILKEACRQNKMWQDRGFPAVRVAVNVSVKQLQQPDFARKLRDIMEETGMDPERLEIEMTESTLMTDTNQMLITFEELKKIGVYLSIDDFGTGYSSLSYLKRLAVHALKIDRSFIRDLPEDEDSVTITEMIIGLAHNLRLEVIAEGVETVQQHNFLLERGCKKAQGYLYSKPLTESQLAEMLGTSGLHFGPVIETEDVYVG
ncbi:putative bifunctional diguanylate cyclase/phosphodiesterase [Paenibacillus sedimenti]|uniref:EAL domain-containing protein n=1 Tax=Paenibacillus sedimenti TaxID=2770274 RepID=A0A926QN11_9BACL|nr:EAL domain-containing protein [Paenibacillus sedimenti]MBD0384493.1 EAL domain-containing protein [Paenibacillus sedimenti]